MNLLQNQPLDVSQVPLWSSLFGLVLFKMRAFLLSFSFRKNTNKVLIKVPEFEKKPVQKKLCSGKCKPTI